MERFHLFFIKHFTICSNYCGYSKVGNSAPIEKNHLPPVFSLASNHARPPFFEKHEGGDITAPTKKDGHMQLSVQGKMMQAGSCALQEKALYSTTETC